MSEVRQDFVDVESLGEGVPNLRHNFIIVEPLTEGYRNLRMDYFVIESLIPVGPEEYMSTEVFPGFGNSVANPAIPAAANPAATSLPGLAFNVHKKPGFRTRINSAASGPEVRSALMEYPIWDYELTYEFLEDSSGADSSLKTIMGFFLARQGSFDSWLFKDPDDFQATDHLCGVADGVTTEFPLSRVMGEFRERIGQVDMDNDISVFVDGVLVDPADYTITLPNRLIFDSAPLDGNVTWTGQFFFVCRFIEDQTDFEKFMDKLWSLNTIEFRSLIK